MSIIFLPVSSSQLKLMSFAKCTELDGVFIVHKLPCFAMMLLQVVLLQHGVIWTHSDWRTIFSETSLWLVFFILSKTCTFWRHESLVIRINGQKGRLLADTCSFPRRLLCKFLKHRATKWRDLKRHDSNIEFLNNYWLTAAVIYLKVSIISSIIIPNMLRDLWSQLTRQNVLRSSLRLRFQIFSS